MIINSLEDKFVNCPMMKVATVAVSCVAVMRLMVLASENSQRSRMLDSLKSLML